jgi:hypothetical protein
MGHLAKVLANHKEGEPVRLFSAYELFAPSGLSSATIAAGSLSSVNATSEVLELLVYNVAAIYAVDADKFNRYVNWLSGEGKKND